MNRALLTLLILFGWAMGGLAEENPPPRFSSPDGRFALRIIAPKEEESVEHRAELIEKASGKVMVDLGIAYQSHLSDTVLVWSADSRWAAFGTRDNRTGETSVYFWNGSAFELVDLPAELPEPDIKYRKGTEGAVKNYGGGVKPVRWLKPGKLELSSDSTMLSRVDERTYTGEVRFTIAFDARHRARVQKVGKTRTKVD
jgi:hypothetical protein